MRANSRGVGLSSIVATCVSVYLLLFICLFVYSFIYSFIHTCIIFLFGVSCGCGVVVVLLLHALPRPP